MASAVMLMFAVFGAESPGAAASDEIAAEASAALPPTGADEAAQGPRFVAHEVVQQLPENDAEDASSLDASSLRELVSDIPTEGPLSPEMRCLAEAVYFEARGEPLAGQLAVARVIVNRAESDAFPDDYCSVVKQRGQFSFVKSGRIPAVRASSSAWRRAEAIARVAHQELWESAAGDALYFHAQRVRPKWASRKIARATIDSHIFYR
ncbi:cell wall hydrolase [Altererythrobacter sp. B11]|uniref:cell wall hydrolase n=1 Tax=Altererythrobacter sp. B11 TaxID=2060312 RepID=UPI001E57FD04|nr:cell wall hydrolase [Altererythrobacter sp. B11]